MPVTAVIWDYDGTLVDTSLKNFHVTREIVRNVAPELLATVPALQDLSTYASVNREIHNWRNLYRDIFKLNDSQTDQAGSLWTEFQLRDTTPTPLFEGLTEIIKKLQHLPQGINSQNSSENIAHFLNSNDLRPYFREIIGYESVDFYRQKPAPDGLLKCIKALTANDAGTILYIGDHDTDMVCADLANQHLQKNGSANVEVRTVAALYGFGNHDTWRGCEPAYRAHTPSDILEIINGIP